MPPAGRGELPAPEAYHDLLKPICSRIDIWHSVYQHIMPNAQAVVEWFKGSSLQPILSALDAVGREKFLAACTQRIARADRPRCDGTLLLRFPRFVIVAVR